MKHSKTKKLVTSAMLISLGTALSLVSEWIPFLNLPFGGTITLASLLPLVLISYLYGIRWGLGSAFVYSLLQMAVGFRTVSALFIPDSDSYMGSVGIAFLILLIDYILAFPSVGLAGIFRNRLSQKWALFWGSVFALFLCYLFHTLSGAIFYGAWAEWFFLESAAKAVKNNGRILYSTCTYDPDENEKVISYILRRVPGWCAVEVPQLVRFRSALADFPCYRLLPEHGFGAGGFCCLLQKNKNIEQTGKSGV